MTTTLFVTGAQRSGTTLVEKLLSGHPDVSLLSQPFPYLFAEAKRAFLQGLGSQREPYPLGDLFLETRYHPADFAGFLSHFVFDEALLLAVFAAMEGYSGQYSRLPLAAVKSVLPDLASTRFVSLLRELYRRFVPRTDAAVSGGKEVLCEEFLPALLDAGFKAVVIVRDPRDMLASLNHGHGPEHGGRLKPTLFNLRNWRKSVAYVVALAAQPGFAWLRYEDLAQEPRARLEALTRDLGLELDQEFPAEGQLRDETGRVWAGNSSYGARAGVDDSSVGVFTGILSREVIRYVEAACWPELRWLGYPTTLARHEVAASLGEFVDPYPLERPELARYLEPSRTDEELRRFALLDEPETPEPRQWFLLPGVHHHLRAGSRAVGRARGFSDSPS